MIRILSLTVMSCFILASCSSDNSNELTSAERDIFLTASYFTKFGFQYESDREKFKKILLPDGSVKIDYEYQGTADEAKRQVLLLNGRAVLWKSKENAVSMYEQGLKNVERASKQKQTILREKQIGVVLGQPMSAYSMIHNNEIIGTLITAVRGRVYYYYTVGGTNLDDNVWVFAVKSRIEMAESTLTQ